jgi:flagellar biogenesis protein FliO
MERKSIPMAFPRKPAPRAATLLLLASAVLALPAHAVPAGAGKGAPPAAAASPAAEDEVPAPPPALVQEKFRKLQKEMSKDAPSGLEASPAGTSGADAAGEKAPEPAGIVSFSLQLLLGLAFVIVLAVVSIRGLKRFQNRMLLRPGKDGAGGDLFEVLETCHLGTQQRVVALRIHDEVGVIGVTPQGISLLTVLKQPAEEIRQARLGTGNSAAFSDNLNKLLDRFKKPKRVADLLDEQEGKG